MVEKLLREGVDDETIADMVGVVLAHNQEAIRETMASVESLCEQEKLTSVRTVRFCEKARTTPAVH